MHPTPSPPNSVSRAFVHPVTQDRNRGGSSSYSRQKQTETAQFPAPFSSCSHPIPSKPRHTNSQNECRSTSHPSPGPTTWALVFHREGCPPLTCPPHSLCSPPPPAHLFFLNGLSCPLRPCLLDKPWPISPPSSWFAVSLTYSRGISSLPRIRQIVFFLKGSLRCVSSLWNPCN